MNKQADLVVIGGGIMGLMTAWFARARGAAVVVLERSSVGNRAAGSGGLTRSFRCDYEDPYYARLAAEARIGWTELEAELAATFLIPCGCFNIGKISLGGSSCYGERSARTLRECGLPNEELFGEELSRRYPQFSIDRGFLDPGGGILLAGRILNALRFELVERGAAIEEGCEVLSADEDGSAVRIRTSAGTIKGGAVVICAGIWTNSVLERLGVRLNRLPITAARPRICRYYRPKTGTGSKFAAPGCPVFACLEFGIYGHPIVAGLTSGLKIGQYLPPGTSAEEADRMSLDRFVGECMPELTGAEVQEVTETDQGSYEMTPDGEFILGRLPGSERVTVSAGFCGTGFKFAPLIGAWGADAALSDRKPPERWRLDRFGGKAETPSDERREPGNTIDRAA